VRSSRSLIVVIVALTMTVLPAAPALGVTYRVRATSTNRWSPATTTIYRDDRVVWRNPTNLEHNIVGYSSNWDGFTRNLAPGTRTAKTFHRLGRFRFRCTLHDHSRIVDGRCEGMCGVVRVI
jgi:plastocyanin